MDGDRLGHGAAAVPVELGAVARQVVEQPARLVLLRHQAGQRVQPPPVVAGLDDARVQPQPVVAVLAGDELELVDVEAELVQPVQPLVDPVAGVVAEDLLARQLVPQRLVARDELGRRLLRRELALATELAPRRPQLAARRSPPRSARSCRRWPSERLGCSSPVSASTR